MIIAKLAGTVDNLCTDHCIVMAGGVGYAVYATSKMLSALTPGEHYNVYIEHLIRQDFQQLCGFLEPTERTAFRALINVQGVGARVGLAILSVLTPAELAAAVSNKDKTMLARADGVGPKLAERLVLELKDKVIAFMGDSLTLSAALPQTSALDDALQGLMALGYNRFEANQALQAVAGGVENPSTQGLIKGALQRLGRV
jgi:Holliday junction DNA helicase RuvA